MVKAYRKNIYRTIKGSIGRFLAIMAIIALGVGFYSGLKLTKPSMVKKAEDYFKENKFYDIKVMTNIGIDSEEIDEVKTFDYVINAEGSYYEDFIFMDEKSSEDVLRAYSITKDVNLLSVVEGRMPNADNECVIDAYVYGSEYIGTTVKVSDGDNFKYDEYKVVGRAESPLFISNERGTTNIGQGRIKGFIFLQEEAFDFKYYKEMYIICDEEHKIYSDEYKAARDSVETLLKEDLNKTFERRYNELYGLYGGLLPQFEMYVLDREQCIGYVTYSSDTDIVNDVAKIFPVFFFLIAALVCSTTMTRMVDDERGQIGTYSSLGYSKGAIVGKYLIYSGLASGIGSVVGFFLGSWLFPYVISHAYRMLYAFGGEVKFYFSGRLLVVCVLVALACSMGTAYFACNKELLDMPASLIRPKAPMAGKRILLERIDFVWKRMSFLHKVTARNIFRFKKRMFMMIIGIAGCQALVLAGFGIRDSISNIVKYQYDEIDTYDIEVSLKGDLSEYTLENIKTEALGKYTDIASISKTTVNIETDSITKSIYLVKANKEDIDGFKNINFIGKGHYPTVGEVILSEKIADMGNIKIGDKITLKKEGEDGKEYTVCGIFENYVWHYAYTVPDEKRVDNTVLIKCYSEQDAYDSGAAISENSDVLMVSVTPENKERVKNMMVMLNAVVWLVIGSAGALAFIVLINLSNINITERVREIATIKVLGFYPNESGAYVFRENIVLTIMGIILGIPLGTILLKFVISQINVDMVSFPAVINLLSYILGVITVLLFTVIVDLIMRKKIDAVDMTGALKSAE